MWVSWVKLSFPVAQWGIEFSSTERINISSASKEGNEKKWKNSYHQHSCIHCRLRVTDLHTNLEFHFLHYSIQLLDFPQTMAPYICKKEWQYWRLCFHDNPTRMGRSGVGIWPHPKIGRVNKLSNCKSHTN